MIYVKMKQVVLIFTTTLYLSNAIKHFSLNFKISQSFVNLGDCGFVVAVARFELATLGL